MLSPRWRKVFRDLWDSKSRTILVVLSIAVGVIAFGGLFAARNNLISNLDVQYQASDAYDIQFELGFFDDELVRWAERQPGVVDAQGLAIYRANILTEGGSENILVFAYEDFNDITVNRLQSQAGAWPPARGEFLLERSFGEMLPLSFGDQITIEVNDVLYDVTYAGTVYDINTQPGFIADDVSAYTTLRTLYDLDIPAQYNTMYLTIERPAFGLFGPQPEEIADDLRADLERLGVPVRSVSVEQVREHWATDNMSGITTILLIVGSFALVLSGFLVVNTISGFLAQQRRQVGVMKIIGATREQIIGVYMVMVIVFGIFAAIIAIPVSGLLGRAIATLIGPNTINFDLLVFRIPLFILGIQVTVSLLAPILSALVPVLSGTAITPAEAISDYNPAASTNPIDAALAKVSGLPRPVLISLRNTFRKKGRLLMTLITLVMAGALFVAILNVRAAVQIDVQDLAAMEDFDVNIRFVQPVNEAGVIRRAESIADVTFVEGWVTTTTNRIRPDNTQSAGNTLIGVSANSPFINPEMLEGTWLTPYSPDSRYDVVVSDEFIENEPDVALGDTISLLYEGHEQNWRVVGIVDVLAGPGIASSPIYAHTKSTAAFAGNADSVTSLMVQTTSRDRDLLERVEREMVTMFENQNIDVSASEIAIDRLESILSAFEVIITLLIVVALMVAIVGGLGLAGTMSLSVLERTREIGVMRSVGASTGTLRVMFITEGVIIGVMSSLIAFAISYPATAGFAYVLGNVIREEAWSTIMTASAPILWLVIIIIVSAIASVAPAQRASQISIREALAYE